MKIACGSRPSHDATFTSNTRSIRQPITLTPNPTISKGISISSTASYDPLHGETPLPLINAQATKEFEHDGRNDERLERVLVIPQRLPRTRRRQTLTRGKETHSYANTECWLADTSLPWPALGERIALNPSRARRLSHCIWNSCEPVSFPFVVNKRDLAFIMPPTVCLLSPSARQPPPERIGSESEPICCMLRNFVFSNRGLPIEFNMGNEGVVHIKI